MEPRLWISTSGEAPHSVALSGERTVVGRSPEAEVTLDDEAVSWNHLEIERKGDVLMASDLDSRNGTALKGERHRQPQRPRAERRAAGPAAAPARRRHADRRRPSAGSEDRRDHPGGR